MRVKFSTRIDTRDRLTGLKPKFFISIRKAFRKLIELGGLVSKAQLEDWNASTLLGALLFLKERESDSQLLDEWTYKGGGAFNEGNA